MLTFSSDSMAHEAEMQAIIWYLTGIAYLDGHFDETERQCVRDQMTSLVEQRARALVGEDLAPHREAIDRWVQHFHEACEMVANEVASYFTESVAEGDDITSFVTSRLKLRCFEMLRHFDEGGQRQLLSVADAIIQADGVVHPAEDAFRRDLERLLQTSETLDDSEVHPIETGSVVVEAMTQLRAQNNDHPFMRAIERDWPSDREGFAAESAEDIALVARFTEALEARRALGAGSLAGKQSVSDLAPGVRFTDGHVNVFMPREDEDVDLLVIGDLHGCYSCLKAALLQADFFGKVQRHHDDPTRNPVMKLVLLGDYIDRGRFSYHGVLRAAMRLYLAAPDHVYVLRGNHEYYIEHRGRVLAPVRPAEAMTSIQDIASPALFETYMKLFETLTTTLIFDRTLFVHAGIPRDAAIHEKWRDLSSLNDPDLRFQMMWSDPSTADVVPDDLQAANARFGFGRKQFQRFMGTLGLRALVRGHEKILDGFKVVYDDPQAQLITLFSSGGRNNNDLPAESGYRDVKPKAMTVQFRAGVTEVAPFEIDYERFNDPRYNAFFEEIPG